MKLNLIISLLFLSLICKTQPFSEDFSSVSYGTISPGWLQINGDNNTVSANLNSYNFNSNAWVTYNAGYDYPLHGNVIASTSWYTPSGTSNDWLITPSFSVPANAFLNWDGISLNAFNPESYEIRISSSGTTSASFTTVALSVLTENSSWTSHSISLNAFTGQTIRIAFVNKSNDSYILFLDNIDVSVPLISDGSVLSIDNQHRYSEAYYVWYHPFCGTFKNLGLTSVTQLELNYQINQDTIVTQIFNYSVPLAHNEMTSFCFTITPPSLHDFQLNRLKVWVSKVNSVPELNHFNDTATFDIYLPQPINTIITKRNLIETFNSSTSEICAQLNTSFDTLLNSFKPNINATSNLNVIRYELNIPAPGNDPSYNQIAEQRKSFYKISSVPTTILNGVKMLHDFTRSEITAGLDGSCFFFMNFINPKIRDAVLTTTINMTSYYNLLTNSKVKLYTALLQKHYFYPNALSGQKYYYHVLRDMLPDKHGKPLALASQTLIPITCTISKSELPQQNSNFFWSDENIEYEIVSFLQDTVTREILQSISAKVMDVTVGLKNESEPNNNLIIYPNPATDAFSLNIKDFTGEPYLIEILSSLGSTVYKTSIQENPHIINIGKLESGIYFLRVKRKEDTNTVKLIIDR